MGSLALNVRTIVAGLINGAVKLIMHPSLLTVMAFIAFVWAAYLQWGRSGALWSFAAGAFLLAMANAKPTT